MRNHAIGAFAALMLTAAAAGAQAAPVAAPGPGFDAAAIRLVGGDGGGTDNRNVTSVYNGGKSPFDPAQPTSRTKTPLEVSRGRAVASGAVHSANRPAEAADKPAAPADK